MTIRRRPRRSNQSLSIVRGIKTLKVYYWTTARLRKLLPGVFSRARQEHFAKAVRALKALPERSKEQIMEDASRVNPKWLRVWPKLKPGQDPDIAYPGPAYVWVWPKSVLSMMHEYADRAPAEGSVDRKRLRELLDGMDDRTRARFIELLVERLPDEPPPGQHMIFLRGLKRKHAEFKRLCSYRHKWFHVWDPDTDIALSRGAEVPNPDLGSPDLEPR